MSKKQTGNTSGRNFEVLVEGVINKKTGYSSVLNSTNPSLTNTLIREYPYRTMYGSMGRLDFRLNLNGKTYYIECKYQGSAGSVDEKLVYTLYNMEQHRDGIKIIVIDGDGWRETTLGWIYEASEKTETKVMNLARFKNFMEKITKFDDGEVQEETDGSLEKFL